MPHPVKPFNAFIIMLRKIAYILVFSFITAYLLAAITAFNKKPAAAACTGIELVIKDTAYAGFVTLKEISAILTKKQLNPVGKDMGAIRTGELEEALATYEEMETKDKTTAKEMEEVKKALLEWF